jgi:nitrite reductase/ring-hydroxylating ferredoxin subunit
MIKKLGIITTLILSCFACGKSSDYVPNVSVNFQLALANPGLNALHNPGGAVLINGYGVAGLVLYRRSNGSYAAYDRCSAYLPQNKSAVTLDNPSLTCTDPASGAKWLLEDGSPVKAPAIKSLKEYTVNISNFEIFVSN